MKNLKNLIVALCVAAPMPALANSMWMECTLFPAAGPTKIEVGVSRYEMEPYLKIDGESPEVLSSSEECGNDIECNLVKRSRIKVRHNNREQTLSFRVTKVLYREEWARGESQIRQVSGTYGGARVFGTCSSYNM